MHYRSIATLLTAAVVSVAGLAIPSLTPHALAAPTPSLTPTSWELTFKHGPLERLMLSVDGKQKPFWFMRYTVVNNSGRDVLFTPDFEILADSGDVVHAFKDVPSNAFTKIKEMYKNPLMESPTNIYGKLLQGDDNAKDGVAIFSALDPDSRDFQVFISGLSGETAEVKNPVTDKPVILQKTLELDYNIPGQAIGIDPRVQLKATKWVMK